MEANTLQLLLWMEEKIPKLGGFFLFVCFAWLFILDFFLIWGYFLLLSLRKTRNPINLQPHDLYETQIKVLCFYFTYLLMGKVLLEVHFKDSLCNSFFHSFSFLLQGHYINQGTVLGRRDVMNTALKRFS